MARQAEHVVVVEPELADDDEADEPAQELGQELDQLMPELGGARVFLERRNLELDDEQCDDDREHAVAERLDARTPQLAAFEPIEPRTWQIPQVDERAASTRL
jgi:hypothetical protein